MIGATTVKLLRAEIPIVVLLLTTVTSVPCVVLTVGNHTVKIQDNPVAIWWTLSLITVVSVILQAADWAWTHIANWL
jgi:hypothetical protein